MNILVYGAGYVGLVQAVGLATAGNRVSLAEVSKDRVDDVNAGKCPIHEPQLPELLAKMVKEDRIHAHLVGTEGYHSALKNSEIVFIAVPTPQSDDGAADLSYVFGVVDQICEREGDLKDLIVVTKSTVPVGTGDKIEKRFQEKKKIPVVASNPEFLKQGAAVQDFLKPERVVIGTTDPRAREILAFLHKPFMMKKDRILLMSRRSAELVKYAANTFLAMKISYINEIAQMAEQTGADIRDVRLGMISDSRIGDQFLFPGVGYGGSCFPKDTLALAHQGVEYGHKSMIPVAVDRVNQIQRTWPIRKLREGLKELKDKKIAIWGLSFKPNTDDLRAAPSVELIRELQKEGSQMFVHDPVAMTAAKERWFSDIPSNVLTYCQDPYEATQGADALVVLTEWLDYRGVSFKTLSEKMNQKIILDGRNIYGPEITKEYGFKYYGVGIPSL